MIKLGRKLALGVLAGGLAIGACQSGDVASNSGLNLEILPTPGTGNGQANFEEFELCKNGSSASFSYSVILYGAPNKGSPGAPQTGTVSLAAGECRIIALFGGNGADVTVTETSAQSGFHLDHVDLTLLDGNGSATTSSAGPSANAYISGQGGTGMHGALARFFNVATPPSGTEGCTPGYWKQDQHFDSWPAPYLPGDKFSAYFEDAFPANGGLTLLQVLGLNGGGLNALGRHTVSALLSAASSGVNYNLTVQQVIDGFNAVFPGGNYEGQKDIFARFNEQLCPLN